MADSTGKRESGIIDGNTLFEGRYFQCLCSDDDVVTSEKLFEPQYCVALWPIVFPDLVSNIGFVAHLLITAKIQVHHITAFR